MFIRIVKTKSSDGSVHEYLRLVEGYREDGRVKQRVVCHLGRKDLLAPHADALLRILGAPQPDRFQESDLTTPESSDWGPFLVARVLWQRLGLETVLDAHGAQDPERASLADRALVLVASRWMQPSSEHRIAEWLERDFVCDRAGRRWTPAWLSTEERQRSRRPRVKVADQQLQGWYRALDGLIAQKERLEEALFERLKDLFSMQVELVFYDLTSTYFEGRGPVELARFGHSRDEKPRNRQVLVGLVMVNGLPIAHHVFAGNVRDERTVAQVTEDVERRFALQRVVFVEDRGMVTTENLELFKRRGHGYIVGVKRRRNQKVFEWIQQAQGAWTECPVGITASEKPAVPRTRVQEVPSGEEGVRVFVVHSEERERYESSLRQRDQERTREALERLKRRVTAGKLKAPHKIGAAAARVLGAHHGHRYYGWEWKEGTFEYFEHPLHLAREKALEGKYVIQTTEQKITPVEAVQAYKELSEVERAFRELKDVLEMRPIYHRRSERVKAHIFVAYLAFVLERVLERRLKEAKVDLSAAEALRALRTIRTVTIDLGNGRQKQCVTKGSRRAQAVLQAVGITEMSPPVPPQGQEAILL